VRRARARRAARSPSRRSRPRRPRRSKVASRPGRRYVGHEMAIRHSPLTHVAIALGVVVSLLFGLWVASGLIAPTYLTSIIFGVVWFVLASVLLGRAVKGRRELRWTVRGTFLATAVVVGAVFAWTSLRDKTVNETLPVAVPASSLSPKKQAAAAPKQNVALAARPVKVAHGG